MTFPSEPICLITGVTLFNSAEGWCKPADLFIFGDRFIVNAAGGGELLGIPSELRKVLTFADYQTPHFERRNVYIFPADKSLLNDAAKAYIKDAPHAPRF